jgi:DNA-cytosine methyltransferase
MRIVLSLFNGMNTLREAMEQQGIKIEKYYSSEIKPYAIKLTQHHYPDTIQVGDINNWKQWDIDWAKVDFIGSGSPCQDLSAAGKRAGINGSKSSLFFVFVEILNHVRKLNPNVLFLQENVGSASKLDVGIMSRALGVYPVRINSSLMTAQLRDRYYWTNIRTKQDGMFGDIVSDIPQPKDRGIMFKDIITDGYVERVKSFALLEHTEKAFGHKDKFSKKAQEYIKGREKFGVNLVYVDTDKAKCLLQGDNKMFIKDEIKQDIYLRKRLSKGTQTPNLVYQVNPSKESGGKQPFMQNSIYDVKGKSVCLTESHSHKIKYITDDLIVRTVNQTEMERLQGFPDGYTSILSKAQAGSLLGDGWTLPIIKHILSFI